jgi:hypothetical protein
MPLFYTHQIGASPAATTAKSSAHLAHVQRDASVHHGVIGLLDAVARRGEPPVL